MLPQETLYHLGFCPDIRAEYAILPGDPGRVERIAACLEEPRFVAENREYKTMLGTLEGKKIFVASTGIGGPSAAIAVEELYRAGVRTFLRVGTCGGISETAAPGDLIVPTGAARQEGTSFEYAPGAYPAVPDFTVASALVRAAVLLEAPFRCGVVQSKDSFYGQHEPERMPVAQRLTEQWEAYKKLGVLASEMECAALFTVCAALHARAGAVLHVVWNQEQEKNTGRMENRFDPMLSIHTAVESLRLLINMEK